MMDVHVFTAQPKGFSLCAEGYSPLHSSLCVIPQIIQFPLLDQLNTRPEIGAFDLFVQPHRRRKKDGQGLGTLFVLTIFPKDPQLRLTVSLGNRGPASKTSLRWYSTAGIFVCGQPRGCRIVGGWKHDGISARAGVSSWEGGSSRQRRNERSTNTREFSADSRSLVHLLHVLFFLCSKNVSPQSPSPFRFVSPSSSSNTPPPPPPPILHIPTWFPSSLLPSLPTPTLAEWPLMLRNLICPWLKEALGWATAPWII